MSNLSSTNKLPAGSNQISSLYTKPKFEVGNLFFFSNKELFLIGKVVGPVTGMWVFFEVIKFVGDKGHPGNRFSKNSAIHQEAIVITDDSEYEGAYELAKVLFG